MKLKIVFYCFSFHSIKLVGKIFFYELNLFFRILATRIFIQSQDSWLRFYFNNFLVDKLLYILLCLSVALSRLLYEIDGSFSVIPYQLTWYFSLPAMLQNEMQSFHEYAFYPSLFFLSLSLLLLWQLNICSITHSVCLYNVHPVFFCATLHINVVTGHSSFWKIF